MYVQLKPSCRTAATAGRLSAATMCRIQRLSAGKHSRSIQFPGTILSSHFHSPIFLGTSGFLQNFLELFLRSQSPNNRQKEGRGLSDSTGVQHDTTEWLQEYPSQSLGGEDHFKNTSPGMGQCFVKCYQNRSPEK